MRHPTKITDNPVIGKNRRIIKDERIAEGGKKDVFQARLVLYTSLQALRHLDVYNLTAKQDAKIAMVYD